ncbi:MAG: hypothetical protein LUE17_00515 [Planctomycetaceae bacterium]|nr:hypothetical protein [Planctomycetaceae bacterium]
MPESRIRRLDGRITLLLLLAACFVCQYIPVTYLPLWLACLGSLFFLREMRRVEITAMLRGGLYFMAFWMVMTVGSDLLAGKPFATAILASLPLGGRLLALTLVGMAFVGLATPMETGRAAAWFLRPVLRSHAWKPALCIAMTAWFLPVMLRLTGQVRAGMRARGLRLSWGRRLTLLVGTSLRILESMAVELAVGLASRRLDDWRSW